MARLSFRAKLVASYVILVVTLLIVVDLSLHSALAGDLTARIDRRLEITAADALDWLAEGIEPERVSRHAARAGEARATIIAADGTVLADSERDPSAVAKMENHATRPEVLQAKQKGGVGRATRRSDTLGVDMRYVAVAGADGSIVRLAVSLESVESTLSAMRARLIGTSIIAFVLALALGSIVAGVSLKPLLAMTAAAHRLARGNFGATVIDNSKDELGDLSRALASLARQLESRIGDLTEERDRLSAMLAGMVEGVLVVDEKGRVEIANRSAQEILEAGGPLAGRTVTEAIRHPAAREVIEAVLADKKPYERTIEDLGARARSVSLSVQPLADGGAVAVLYDLTRLRKLETIRRDFVSNVSHELQTPVASIQSYSESLLDGALSEPETAKKFAEVIHRNALRMGRLVKDLLELSRIEARAPEETKRVELDPREITEHVVETILGRAREETAKIEVDVPEDLRAIGDPDGVAQMLLNLADNALKYGKKGGTVRIRGRREGEFIVLSVADDGPGIESRHHSRVFERFYRIDEGRSRERGGTGLGLAIVKHLAEAMGGSASVQSEMGKGSEFSVRIPAARP